MHYLPIWEKKNILFQEFKKKYTNLKNLPLK